MSNRLDLSDRLAAMMLKPIFLWREIRLQGLFCRRYGCQEGNCTTRCFCSCHSRPKNLPHGDCLMWQASLFPSSIVTKKDQNHCVHIVWCYMWNFNMTTTTLDILFLSNHKIHKSLCGLCFLGFRHFNWNILVSKGLKPKNKGHTNFY